MNLVKQSTKQKLRNNAYERVRVREVTQVFLQSQRIHWNLKNKKNQTLEHEQTQKPKLSITQLRKTNWVTVKPCDKKAKRKKSA